MKTGAILLNATSIRKATGLDYHNLHYYRQKGYIKGYRLEGGTEWFYKLDSLSKLKKTKHQPEKLKDINLSGIIATNN